MTETVNVISTVPLLDSDGNVIVPTAVSYVVLDETDTLISGPTSIAGPWSGSVSVTLSETIGATPVARTVIYSFTTSSGDIINLNDILVLRPVMRLVFLMNTTQTMAQAMMTADTMPNIPAWLAATDDDRVVAMMEAYIRLTRVSYLIKYPEMVDLQNVLRTDWTYRITPQMWPVMTSDLFFRYPPSFITALRQAQVCEANVILTSDPIGDKIRAGLFSETVGQSSMMFRPGIKPLRTIVDRATLTYLTGYLDNRFTLTRS